MVAVFMIMNRHAKEDSTKAPICPIIATGRINK